MPKGFTLDVDGEQVKTNKIKEKAHKQLIIRSPDKKNELIASSPDSDDYDRFLEESKDFLKKYEVDSISELRGRNANINSIESKIISLKSKIETTLEDYTRDELAKELGVIEVNMAKLNKTKKPKGKKPSGELDEWKIRVGILSDEVTQVQENLTIKIGEKGHISEKNGLTKKSLENIDEEIKALKAEYENHAKEHGKDEDIEKNVKTSEEQYNKLFEIWKKLDDERVIAEDQKQKTAERLRDEVTDMLKSEGEINKIEGKLSEIRRNNPQGELVSLLAEKEKYDKKKRSEEIRACALRLLENALSEQLKKHKDAIGGPIQEKMQLWTKYMLQDNSEIIMNEKGEPSFIRNNLSQEIEIGEQSFGTREQISVLYRLAVAQIISEQSGRGVCIMLDDPFGHTDKGRRQRILEIINQEIDKYWHQVLLFTCKPEDFQGHGMHISLVREMG